MKFLIYTQDNCSFCEAAKAFLRRKGFSYLEINLNTMSAQSLLDFKNHFKMAPQIWIDGGAGGDRHIGGYTALLDFFEETVRTAPEIPSFDHLKVKRLHPLSKLPTRGSEDAIGLDLYANLGALGEEIMLSNQRGTVYVIPLGIAVAFPQGHYLRIAPRSGLGSRGLTILGGVIDYDYRGELKALCANLGPEPILLRQGERIAQGILERASILPVVEVEALDDTERGTGGLGSTGR